MKNLIKNLPYYTLGYAIIWGVVFSLCFVIDKTFDDAMTATVLKYVKYAGYPLWVIGWALGMGAVGILYVIGQILGGTLYLLKLTFPYSMYVIGIPLAIWGIYKIAVHLLSAPGPSNAELEAQERHEEHMRVVKDALMLKTLSDMSKK